MSTTHIDKSTPSPDRQHQPQTPSFTRRVMIVVGIVTTAVLLLLLAWYTSTILLLAFTGLLLATFLRGLSDWVSDHTRLSGDWSLALVVVLLLLVVVGGGWLLAPSIQQQSRHLAETLPQSLQQLEQLIMQFPWSAQVLTWVQESARAISDGSISVSRITGVFSTAFGAAASVVLITFIGIYLAIRPDMYVQGILRLVPPHRRARASEVLQTIGLTLQHWLIGKAISMVFISIITAIGLWLLGIPLALTLALLAGLLSFIPNIGPILALIPAMLIALTQSPFHVVYVIVLYSGVQALESYILTPLIEMQTVSLPPALTLIVQSMLAILFGFLGILVAAPLIASGMVLVKMLYIEDVLHDHTPEKANEQQLPREPGSEKE